MEIFRNLIFGTCCVVLLELENYVFTQSKGPYFFLKMFEAVTVSPVCITVIQPDISIQHNEVNPSLV